MDGETAPAVLGSRTRPRAPGRDPRLLPTARQGGSPAPTSHQFCCCNSRYRRHTASPGPQGQPCHLQMGKRLDESGVNRPGFLWKCLANTESEFTAASSNSLQATLSQVFPSGHPYQQFGFRHLASPLTHSYCTWTGCIKQRASALHHYSGSQLNIVRTSCGIKAPWHLPRARCRFLVVTV